MIQQSNQYQLWQLTLTWQSSRYHFWRPTLTRAQQQTSALTHGSNITIYGQTSTLTRQSNWYQLWRLTLTHATNHVYGITSTLKYGPNVTIYCLASTLTWPSNWYQLSRPTDTGNYFHHWVGFQGTEVCTNWERQKCYISGNELWSLGI